MTEHGSSRELFNKTLQGIRLRIARYAPGADIDRACWGLTCSRPLKTRVPGVGVAAPRLERLGETGSRSVRGEAYRVTGIRASAEWARFPAAIAAIDPFHILGETADQGDAINVDVLSALPIVARDYRYSWRDSIRYAAGSRLGARRAPVDDRPTGAVQVRPLGRGEVRIGKRDALARYRAGDGVEVRGVNLIRSAPGAVQRAVTGASVVLRPLARSVRHGATRGFLGGAWIAAFNVAHKRIISHT
jgi:hypothetical protein